MCSEWVAAYYPSDLVEDQRLKTLFCLLYDRVVFHFPVGHMACGGGHGISGFYSDDPLVEEGVLDLREEFLLDEIEGDFTPGHPWGTDEEFAKYHDLNVAGMALKCCAQEDAVPATGRRDAPVPVSLIAQLDISRSADLQAGLLAVHSLDLALPAFGALNSFDILDARDRLREQLGPFRAAMYSLAPRVRAAIDGGASLHDTAAEARYLAQTDIIPRLDELKRRLQLERGAFWRKLTQKEASLLPSIALKWMSGAGAAAAVDAAKLAGGIGSQAIDNEQLRARLLANGGLGFLLAAQENIEGKDIAKNRKEKRDR